MGTDLLASLGTKEKIGTLLLASEIPVSISRSRTVCLDFPVEQVVICVVDAKPLTFSSPIFRLQTGSKILPEIFCSQVRAEGLS